MIKYDSMWLSLTYANEPVSPGSSGLKQLGRRSCGMSCPVPQKHRNCGPPLAKNPFFIFFTWFIVYVHVCCKLYNTMDYMYVYHIIMVFLLLHSNDCITSCVVCIAIQPSNLE